jgi:hypothetical protein
MNCEVVREQLSAWCDGQLELPGAVAVDDHLAICSECRAASESLREQDAQLRRVFRPQRSAAQRVAARVVERLEIDRAPVQVPLGRPAFAGWGALLLAAAAGFLLAVVLLQPWHDSPRIARAMPGSIGPLPQAAPVAQLVVATGRVDVRRPGEQNWQASNSTAFHCPSGSAVRTGANVQCELKTSSGGVVRLNNETQVKLTAGDTIEIECGQVWCSSPDGMAMNVLAPAGKSPRAPADAAWSVACPADACVLTGVGRNGSAQVTTSAGEIDVHTATARRTLKPGESVSIVKGAILHDELSSDPLLTVRWAQPLLVRKGFDNQELSTYVDQLLAQVGQPKVGRLYEQDIRSLGPYAALPLVHYVRSPISRDDPTRRQAAMRIASDIASSWVIGDLVELLGDADAETRFLAARTLERLTGLDQDRSPDAWREDLTQCQPTIDLWRQWWAENQSRYSLPPPSGSST